MRTTSATPTILRTERWNVLAVGLTAEVVAVAAIATLELPPLWAAVLVGGVLAALVAARPTAAVVVTFLYLAFFGDLRRYIVACVGVTTNDPLLLVAPITAILLVLKAMIEHRTSLHSRLSKLILGLMVFMVLETINPLQGGIQVGVAGGLFFLVPLLWFWIGQAWGTPEFYVRVVRYVVVPVGVFAAILGLLQAYRGYMWYEVRWFRLMYETASRPDIRPFATFCSWAEYAGYITIALVIILVPALSGRLRARAASAPLFLFAIVIASVREAIFFGLLSLAAVWSARGRSAAAAASRLVIAVAVLVALLVAGMSKLKDADVSSEVKEKVEHTTAGVLDVGNSSAGGHLELIWSGIVEGVLQPTGYGLGYPTQAGTANGGHSSEFDFSDVFLACGVVGGVYYLFVIFVVYRDQLRYWQRTHAVVALYVLGVSVVELGHLLSGGAYAIAALTWFGIGVLDGAARPVPRTVAARSTAPAVGRPRPRRLAAGSRSV